jgi:2-aminoadipate transaminase
MLHEDGPDPGMLAQVLDTWPVRLFYAVPNSQNPSGITYTGRRRRELASVLKKTSTLFIEDDAYGELNFGGETMPSMREFIPDQIIITGLFSKILAPGMRLGWVVAPREIMESIVVAKQASDLYSNYVSQRIAYEYLDQQDIDDRIRKIRSAYKNQCDCMIQVIEETSPESVTYTRPQGGMFIWVTLPEGCSSMDIFEHSLKENVAVLPGTPFYIDGGDTNTMRFNFSNSIDERIVTGIGQLAKVIRRISNDPNTTSQITGTSR